MIAQSEGCGLLAPVLHHGDSTGDQGKLALQRVGCVRSVSPTASAGCWRRLGRAPGGVPYPPSFVEGTPSLPSEANQTAPPSSARNSVNRVRSAARSLVASDAQAWCQIAASHCGRLSRGIRKFNPKPRAF